MAPRGQIALAAVPVGLLVAIALLFRAFRKLGSNSASLGFVKTLAQAAVGVFSHLPEELKQPLLSSLYISLPLSVVGGLGGLCWKAYGFMQSRLHWFVEKNCKVALTFHNSDKHYDHVVDFIGTRCAVETGRLLASTKPRAKPNFQEMLAGWLGGKTKAPTLYYQPDLASYSDFFVWVDDEGVPHKIWIYKWVEKPQIRSDSGKNQRDPECIVLTLWWTTDPKPLKEFLDSALHTMLKDDGGNRIDIYVKHMWMPMWTKAISKDRRDRDTIILDENLAEDVVEDLRHFFTKKAADWYHNAGIPYRRGYLLYGPPGCGKTSFAQVLAGELGLDVCLMNLSNQEMNDDDLAELLRNAPPRSMLLLEDVDAIFVERASADKSRRGGISFSGLLNALDGAAAQEGCVIMLTTNHKDRLDEALIRPGRCDVHVHIQKASQDQAKRMYCRFFAKEAKIRSVDVDRSITTTNSHSFQTGDQIVCKLPPLDGPFATEGCNLDESTTYYAHVRAPNGGARLSQTLRLYDSKHHAEQGGSQGLVLVTGGKGVTLRVFPLSAGRFGSRIPEKQISMAKLQGYLMKQKLEAEQHFKALRDKGQLPQKLAAVDLADEDQKLLFNEAVERFAAEAAVMNVHELLDVKYEAEAERVHVYDHLHRLGLHRFAPFFEHFGIRQKSQLTADVKDRMAHWDPDLKFGPYRDRIVALIDQKDDTQSQYKLADLSVLRDRFLSTYQNMAAEPASGERVSTEAPEAAPVGRPQGEASSDEPRAPGIPSRQQLVRQRSGLDAPEEKLNLLDMAHRFQEALEDNGKTRVSFWQLEVHFRRFAGDPQGALRYGEALCKIDKDRTAEERTVAWMTTFTFLSRIGLQEHAFSLEDNGFKLWIELKHLSKDELKDKGEMPAKGAELCYAVLQGSYDRPDLVRNFQTPDFADLQAFFLDRFPGVSKRDAQCFAWRLTDDAGSTYVSCFQVGKYLTEATSVKDALANLSQGLPLPHVAEAARVRPEKPPPPPESDAWVHVWLKGAKLENHSGSFVWQSLSTREELLGAPVDHNTLNDLGIKKLGDRCKILSMIAAEKKKDEEGYDGGDVQSRAGNDQKDATEATDGGDSKTRGTDHKDASSVADDGQVVEVGEKSDNHGPNKKQKKKKKGAAA